MKMIVGLGNPGNKYDGTKHNVGFAVVDSLLEANNLQMTDQKFRADYTVWHHPKDKLLLVKPFTYMNLSGEAVLPLMSYYGVGMEELLVIYDDMDLEPGRIRLRQKGSAGGHNGMRSIIAMLGSDDFNRLRIGIGRPEPGWKVVDHVLAPFKAADQEAVDQAVDLSRQAVGDWLEGADWLDLMNRYNAK